MIVCLVKSEQLREELNASEDLNIKLGSAAASDALQWKKYHKGYKTQIDLLQARVNDARQDRKALDEQKSENAILRDTIDRLMEDVEALQRRCEDAEVSAIMEGPSYGVIGNDLASELLVTVEMVCSPCILMGRASNVAYVLFFRKIARCSMSVTCS